MLEKAENEDDVVGFVVDEKGVLTLMWVPPPAAPSAGCCRCAARVLRLRGDVGASAAAATELADGLGPRRHRGRGSCVLRRGLFHVHDARVRATEHAPRGRFRLLERRHARAEIVGVAPVSSRRAPRA